MRHVLYVVIFNAYLPQNNFAPTPLILTPHSPPVSSKVRVVPLCSLLICLSKLQFVGVRSEPRPRNVILQIRYTP